MPYHRLETELRGRARELISGGKLPCFPPIRIWGGYGVDLACSLCEQPITRNDVEYEIEHRTPEGANHLRFHYLCHVAWQIECIKHQSESP